MAKYGSMPAGAAKHLSLHKRTVSLVLAIGAVVALTACVAFVNRGQRVGLEARVEGYLPYANMEELAANHNLWVGGHDMNPVHMVHSYREQHSGWNVAKSGQSPAADQASMKTEGGATQQQLSSAKTPFAAEAKNVETSLAQDMRKLWKAKTPAAKQADLKKVEVMKGRFEALLQAAEASPMLEVLPSRNDGLTHVVDPRTGHVYTLYEYHVPGGYEDAVLDPHPIFANDMKGLAPFADPAGRNPIYQGTYPDYDSIYPPAGAAAEEGMETRARTPTTLYEYHVPGGYEDAELEPSPLFGNDLKGLAPFTDRTGRNPIYQGEHFDYDALGTGAAEGSAAAEAVAARPQGLYEYHIPGGYEDAELEPSPLFGNDLKGLAPFTDRTGRNPIYQGEHFDYDALGTGAAEGSAAAEAVAHRPQGLYQIRGQPAQFVVADRAGQLRLVSRRSVRGMIAAERDAAANREWAMKKPEVIARKEAQVAAMKKQMAHSKKAAPHHAKAAAPVAHKAKEVKRKMKAVTQELAETPKMVEAASQQWGSIYQPSLKSEEARDPTPMSGAGKAMFNHWSSLATKYNKVYDPSEDKTAAHNFGALKGTWWSAGKKGDDAWWKHDHSKRGY